MVKKNNSEQEKINKERIVDIVLTIQYMKSLDIDKEFFTDKGDGFLEGLASVKDEIKFISKNEYEKLNIKNNNNIKVINTYIDENNTLMEKIKDLNKIKYWWKK